MSNIFQQIVDNVKELFSFSETHPLFLEKDAHLVGEEAEKAYDEKNYQEAIDRYTEALKITPDDEYLLSSRSHAYIRLRDYDKALRDVNRLLHKSPYKLDAIELRGTIYTGLRQFHSAVEDFTYVINAPTNQNKWWAYYERAICGYSIDLPLAVHDFTLLIELDQKPDSLYLLYERRGNTYAKLGETSQAIDDYQKSIQLKSDNPSPHQGLAKIFYQQKKYDMVMPILNKLIELEPDNIEHVNFQGDVYCAMKQYQQAIEIYENILNMQPTTYHLHNTLAFFYPHLDENDKALHHAILAIERNRPSSAIFDTRAQIYWLMGDYDKALADFEFGSELGNRGLCVAGQAVTYFAMGDETKAIELWHKAIELDDNLADPAIFDTEYHYTPRYVEAVQQLAEKAEQNKPSA